MTRPRTALALALVPGGVAVAALLSHRGLHLLDGVSSPGGDPAAAVSGVAAIGAALVAGWLALCLALSLAAEIPGRVGEASLALRDRVAPAVVQRWAAVVLGASVGATIAPGTAVAAVQQVPEPAAIGTSALAPAPGWTPAPEAPVAATPAPEPGWVPERPAPRPRADTRLVTGRQRPASEDPTVVVRRGDTLWSIASAHLGSGAGDVEIAREWPRWHEVNRGAIGTDPHTLLPGTVLTPPPAA